MISKAKVQRFPDIKRIIRTKLVTTPAKRGKNPCQSPNLCNRRKIPIDAHALSLPFFGRFNTDRLGQFCQSADCHLPLFFCDLRAQSGPRSLKTYPKEVESASYSHISH
jgi:hypothetical protein